MGRAKLALALQRGIYEAKASSAVRFRITNVDPSSRINCFFFRSLNNRVTVSRDAPIICAISSCVSPERTRISFNPFVAGGVQDNSNVASLPADDRARIKIANIAVR